MNIFKRIAERIERNNWDRQWIQRKFDALSLVERNAYEQIVERYEKNHMGITYSFMWLIPYAIFYMAIAAGISYYFLNVDIISSLVSVAFTLVKAWIPLVLLGLVLDFISMVKLDKLKRKLLYGR